MEPDINTITDIAQKMLYTTFLLSLPVLLTALSVGIVISLVQTVTSIQEMTITFVPKLLAVMAVLAMALPWMIAVMINYTHELWALMSNMN